MERSEKVTSSRRSNSDQGEKAKRGKTILEIYKDKKQAHIKFKYILIQTH